MRRKNVTHQRVHKRFKNFVKSVDPESSMSETTDKIAKFLQSEILNENKPKKMADNFLKFLRDKK